MKRLCIILLICIFFMTGCISSSKSNTDSSPLKQTHSLPPTTVIPKTEAPTTTAAPTTTPAPNPWKTQISCTLNQGNTYRVGPNIMQIINISPDNKHGPDVSIRLNDINISFDKIGDSYNIDNRNRLVLTSYIRTGYSTGEVTIAYESLDFINISTKIINYKYHSTVNLERFESVEVDDHVIKLVDASFYRIEFSGTYFDSANFEVDGITTHISNLEDTLFSNDYIKIVLTGGQVTSTSKKYTMEIEIYYMSDMPKPSCSTISWKKIDEIEIYGPRKIKIGDHIVELYNKRFEHDTIFVVEMAIDGIEGGIVRAREICQFFIGETIMIANESYIRRTVSNKAGVEYTELYPVLTFYYLDNNSKPSISVLSATR